MSGMDELVTWLRAQLDETEETIRYCLRHGEVMDRPDEALAEIEAKRERLDWIEGELADDATNETAQWLAKLEAKPFARRVGWRPEWTI